MRRLDWVLVVATLALSGVGALLVWSATSATAGPALGVRHLVNVGVGVVMAGVVARADLRLLRAYAPLLYGLSLVGLALVLSPLGSSINGSRSWIVLPVGFSVQPAEFAKIGLVVGAALLLSERLRRDDAPGDGDVWAALALAAVPLVLVMLQPDLGSAVVLAAIIAGMVCVSGARARWLVGLLAVSVVAGVAALATPVLDDYQRDRLLAFVDPGADPRGIGYQTSQVRIAIGSGGLWGQGLFAGGQTQGGFVPYDHTDFVFSVAGEELGFVGAATVVVLIGVVLWRGMAISSASPGLFGRLLAGGVVVWFAFQAFQNIGMSLGIVPVTGLPLPFVSYGGSSMFACWIGVGLLLNVHLRSATR